ncbi:MAG: T9SS type A sorting domain-containing protein [Flavobacteriales bacterium]|jgi:hypothetical protein|nr:T9SS type A sorting domain-containing protein [Flavobacteriales bacterium]
MLKLFFFFLLSLTTLTSLAQNCSTSAVTILDQSIKETSGLIFFNGKLVTHNDSGDSPNLYEIDTITGAVTRTVSITNASNVDWEDITQDDHYIYVGDFGNNNGNRTDLIIYRIAKADFNTQTNVTADSIVIQYADQTNFSAQPNANDYDCEAMIAYQDSLMLFSKNWLNEKTYLYTLPKTPGNYNLVKRDSFDTQGTITGATYNPNTNVILLIGYKSTTLSKYLWELAQFQGYNVLQGTNTKCNVSLTGSIQIEAIAVKGDFDYFISSEEISYAGITLDTYLSSYSYGGVSIDEKKKFSIELFPNPVDHYLNFIIRNISNTIKHKVKITNSMGQTIYENDAITTPHNSIDTSNFPKGVYFISVTSKENAITQSFIKN